MKVTYLKNSHEIRKKLKYLFQTKFPKVAVVAFVGSRAVDYISNYKNLTVYCWPHPGATNANGVRQLKSHGVRVNFCDNMHKKIYWAKDRGVIITSANLTYNALSGNVLQETGVFIDDKNFDIQSHINSLINVRDAETAEIDDLEKQSRIKGPVVKNDNSLKLLSFKEFMDLKDIPPVKMLYYSFYRPSKEQNRLVNKVKNDLYLDLIRLINDNDINEEFYQANYETGDVVLQVKTSGENDLIRGNNKHPLTWLFVDAKTRLYKNTYTVVQYKEHCDFPFDVKEACFVEAFKKVCNNTKWEDIVDKKGNVKKNFWEKVLESMDC